MPTLQEIDVRVLHALYDEHRIRVLDAVMITITTLGGGWGMLGFLPLFVWRRTRHLAAATTIVISAAALVVFVLKIVVGRSRPCFTVPGVFARWERPTDFSFPSGHTTGSFAFAACIAILLWTRPSGSRLSNVFMACAAFVFASAVGLSRVYLGVHYPSDVLGSALLGMTLGIVGGSLSVRHGSA